MIEAYEIGIKLALQDGVSEGIAAIRRDLGSLDQAIAQTALRLDQLQRIGAQALTASRDQPGQAVPSLSARRPALPVTPSPLVEPEPMAAPVGVQAATPAQSPLPRHPAEPAVVVAASRAAAGEPGLVPPAAMPRPDAAAPAVATRLTPIMVDAARPSSVPPLPEQPTFTPPTGAVVMASSPVAAMPRLTTPILQTPDDWTQKGERPREPTSARPAGLLSSIPEVATAPPRQPFVEPAQRDRVRRIGHRHSETREVGMRDSAPAVVVPAARVATVPAKMPTFVSATPSMAPQASSSYAPPAASSQVKETSMRGDVFLDGARVGRWMSEQMAREAGRPNTGPTGFDPRRSPAWPGAAVTW